MKYKKIYDVIKNHPGIQVTDYSNWRFSQTDYIIIMHPLNIVIEVPHIKLRLWINHIRKQYSISTADLTFDCSSREYHHSFRNYYFRNQRETVEMLERILSQKKETQQC